MLRTAMHTVFVLFTMANAAFAATLGFTTGSPVATGDGNGALLYDSGFETLTEDFFFPGALTISNGNLSGESLLLSAGPGGIDSVGLEGGLAAADILATGFTDNSLEFLLGAGLGFPSTNDYLLTFTGPDDVFDFAGASEQSGLPISVLNNLPTDSFGYALIQGVQFEIAPVIKVTTPTAVPLPASGVLLSGSILLAGAFVSKRRRKT